MLALAREARTRSRGTRVAVHRRAVPSSEDRSRTSVQIEPIGTAVGRAANAAHNIKMKTTLGTARTPDGNHSRNYDPRQQKHAL